MDTSLFFPCQLTDIWVISTFELLGIMLIFLKCVDICFHFPWMY